MFELQPHKPMIKMIPHLILHSFSSLGFFGIDILHNGASQMVIFTLVVSYVMCNVFNAEDLTAGLEKTYVF